MEIRNNIAQYEDENEDHSPLFGFLRYRRRNVIIKYLPEDCSRLVQGGFCLLSLSVCTAAHYVAGWRLLFSRERKLTRPVF